MSDSNDDAVKLLILLIVFLVAPLFAPEACIIISAIIWLLVYVVSFFKSIGFDSTTSLPWWFSDHFSWGMCFIYIFVLITLGLTRGLLGVMAMVMTWGPLVMLPGFLLAIGVAVNQPWNDYKQENYTAVGCRVLDGKHVCEFVPKSGLALPSFFEDYNTEDIVTVIPYSK